MKTIYKYPLAYCDRFARSMPEGSKIISVGIDPNGTLCAWAEVEPAKSLTMRTFNVVGTGNPLPDPIGEFVGTVLQPPFVWHIYASKP